MTSNISERISALSTVKADISNIHEIGEMWLSVCGDLFADEAGFGLDNNGKRFFIPSKLVCDISTGDILRLLNVADELERHKETSQITCENLYKHSLKCHMKQRAENDDIQAKVVMFFRAQRIHKDADTISG